MQSTPILPRIPLHMLSVWLIGSLTDHNTFSGRRVPEYDIDPIREVIEASYRIIYYIKSDQVDVLAVIHGAMNVLTEPEQ